MQNTLKIKRTKTALVFNLAIIACEIAAIIIVFCSFYFKYICLSEKSFRFACI
jgi:hypothetical protein